ncbi:hypothetical protein NDU88_007369 [Pleurodeles waltl]|uniref:Uncharacterized protein n=1 Tax=Pleurodeles waltl TaxID=8319 RepID=A0AAV7PTE3_PLEWA|nr:hypothetical protein NDU88_007369 [Pleurodeles waltl]
MYNPRQRAGNGVRVSSVLSIGRERRGEDGRRAARRGQDYDSCAERRSPHGRICLRLLDGKVKEVAQSPRSAIHHLRTERGAGAAAAGP